MYHLQFFCTTHNPLDMQPNSYSAEACILHLSTLPWKKYCSFIQVAAWSWVVSELWNHQPNHSCLSHLLTGLLQRVLHGAALEEHPQPSIGSECGGPVMGVPHYTHVDISTFQWFSLGFWLEFKVIITNSVSGGIGLGYGQDCLLPRIYTFPHKEAMSSYGTSEAFLGGSPRFWNNLPSDIWLVLRLVSQDFGSGWLESQFAAVYFSPVAILRL